MERRDLDPLGGTPSDADLARRIAAAPGRETDAEEELCRRLAPRLRLYGLRHLRGASAAADLVQQALLVTIEALRAGKVREPERLASFVLGVCRTIVEDARRGGRRRRALLERWAGDVPAGTAYRPPDLDHAALARCLDRLAARDRSVLVLSFYGDRTAQEVGEALGLSPGSARVIRHRALARLRSCMTGGTASS